MLDSTRQDATRLRFFVVVSPGLESLLGEELAELEITAAKVPGGAEGEGTYADLMKIHLRSRLAESVRVRLKSFPARSFAELERGLERLPWHAYLLAGRSTHLSVTCHKSRLYHSDAVAERCRRALEQRLGAPMPDAPRNDAEQTVFLRLVRDQVETSVDASGPRLYRRGYKSRVGKAPLRETLAAALVRVALHPGPVASGLWDPFCGSGTVLLEWLTQVQGYTPSLRSFAFEQWPAFRRYQEMAQALRAEHAVQRYSSGRFRAIGSDLDPTVLKAAAGNAAELGASADLELWPEDFRTAVERIPRGYSIITNPPYGRRVGQGSEVARLYRDLERLLLERTDLRPAVVATGFAPFLRRSRLRWTRVTTFAHGGLRVSVLRLD